MNTTLNHNPAQFSAMRDHMGSCSGSARTFANKPHPSLWPKWACATGYDKLSLTSCMFGLVYRFPSSVRTCSSNFELACVHPPPAEELLLVASEYANCMPQQNAMRSTTQSAIDRFPGSRTPTPLTGFGKQPRQKQCRCLTLGSLRL